MHSLKVPLRNGTNSGSNGSICGGRSSSQVSIYDYPEHLNPFYEEENHKRIRFWHIGKHKNDRNNNGNNNRRGSFSLGGLRDMWSFKTFRLKKKSSNFGINKTSESPPPLRRPFDSNENHYGTYDPRMRHTVGNGTLNNNFLRNVPYRASLQDMRTTQSAEHNDGLNFERNNKYRSTIQTPTRNRYNASGTGESPQAPPRRYVYGGSLTPQPRLRSVLSDDDNYSGISRGSSQVSITSKNPFEEDDSDVVMRKMSSPSGNSCNDNGEEKRKRYYRKKRRAPAPPTPIPKVINEELQSNNQPIPEEDAQITNLAVEIQNYVKSIADDSTQTVYKNDKVNNVQNENAQIISTKELITSENQISTDNAQQIQNVTIVEVKTIETIDDPPKSDKTPQIGVHIIKETTTEIKLDTPKEKGIDKTENDEKIQSIEKHLIENTDPNIETNGNQIIEIHQESNNDVTNIEIKQNSENINDNKGINSKIEKDSEINYEKQIIELKITESVEDISERSQQSEISNEIINEISYISINEQNQQDEAKKINTDTVEERQNNTNNENQQQYRRRSVRDIIESINRNQKLLKINQNQELSNDDATSEITTKNEYDQIAANDNASNYQDDDQQQLSNDLNIVKAPPRKKHNQSRDDENYTENLRELSEHENEIKSIIKEMEEIAEIEEAKYKNETKKLNNIEDDDNDYYDEKYLENLSNKINNNENNCELFKKCEIKKEIIRETSPTSSNLNWNPVPKPKRTKKISIGLREEE